MRKHISIIVVTTLVIILFVQSALNGTIIFTSNLYDSMTIYSSGNLDEQGFNIKRTPSILSNEGQVHITLDDLKVEENNEVYLVLPLEGLSPNTTYNFNIKVDLKNNIEEPLKVKVDIQTDLKNTSGTKFVSNSRFDMRNDLNLYTQSNQIYTEITHTTNKFNDNYLIINISTSGAILDFYIDSIIVEYKEVYDANN